MLVSANTRKPGQSSQQDKTPLRFNLVTSFAMLGHCLRRAVLAKIAWTREIVRSWLEELPLGAMASTILGIKDFHRPSILGRQVASSYSSEATPCSCWGSCWGPWCWWPWAVAGNPRWRAPRPAAWVARSATRPTSSGSPSPSVSQWPPWRPR